MTLTELRYIVAVAQTGHFGQAAKLCFVSQPTLSLGIKKLEDELGTRLFERNHKELVITDIGRQIVSTAQQVLQGVDRIRGIVQSHADPLASPLRVGAINTVGPYLFPSLIPTVRELAKDLPLIIQEGQSQSLLDKLNHGELDVALVSLPCREAGLEVMPLFAEPLVVLLPRSHPLTASEGLSIQQIKHETVLLLSKNHCLRKQVMEIDSDLPRPTTMEDSLFDVLECGSLETIRHMVASGMGITILPTTAACADKYAQRLVCIRRFSNIEPKRTIALVHRKGYTRQPAIELLVRAINLCGLTGVEFLSSQSDLHGIPDRTRKVPSALLSSAN